MWSWRPKGRGGGAGGVPAAAVSSEPLPGIMRPTRGPGSGSIAGIATPAEGIRPTRISREVSRLLLSLGRTRGDVAAALERGGVRALPGDSPVRVFLCAVVGADPGVKAVSVNERSVTVELRPWWRSSVVVDLPSVVHEFLDAFGEGCYPALLPPGYRAEGDRAEGDRAENLD